MSSAGSGAGSSAAVVTTAEAARQYVDRMIAEHSGMKALLLDEETVGLAASRPSAGAPRPEPRGSAQVGIISVIYSQTQILEKEGQCAPARPAAARPCVTCLGLAFAPVVA